MPQAAAQHGRPCIPEKEFQTCCQKHLPASWFAQGDGCMEVPLALPASQPLPWAGTARADPPATPTHVMGRGCLSFTYPGAMDGVVKVRSFRGQQQPATINGFGLQRNSRETFTHSRKWLNVDQHHRESMVRDHGKLEQPQHEGSCVSSASCTPALSLPSAGNVVSDGNPWCDTHCVPTALRRGLGRR